jgi:chromosome segregation ATPase
MADWEDAPTKSGGWEEAPVKRDTPVTDVLNRSLVAGTLGAPVDIAATVMRPFGYKEEMPVGGSEWIGKQMEKAGFVSPERRPLAEFATGLAPAVVTGGAGLARYGFGRASELAQALRGVKPQPLKTSTAEQLGQLTAEQQQQLARTQRTQEQIAQQPKIAEQRAQLTATTPEVASEIQRGVREKVGARVAKTTTAEQQAARAAKTAQRELQQTEAAMSQLEQRMSSQPGITADEFGKQLQQTTEKLANDGIKARKDAAGYEQVFKAAGDAPTVDTSGVKTSIDKVLKQTRNPTLQNILSEIKSQITTGAKIDPTTGEFLGGETKLSLRSVDSLKGYLDSVIQGRVDKYGKLDKEIANTVQNIKNQLMMTAKSTHKEYGEAMNRFREMSRPLDIVERRGALKPVLDEDPVSTAYRMTEAEVAGYIIRKANAGNPVFSRLLEVRPDLKESSRLYFTKDLFGKEAAPTSKSFENWLSTNERALRQTGLYDQFSSLKKAQSTAQSAIDVAKGKVTAAQARLSTAEQQRKAAESVAGKASQRLTQALKTAETPEQIAQRISRSEKRAQPAVSKFASQAERQQKTLDVLSELKSNLERATKPEQIKTEVKATAEKLKDLGLINEGQRDQMLREVAQLGDSIEARNEALKRVRNLVIGAATTAGLGYGGRHIAYGVQ